jgi:hypothetical protein
MAVVLGLLPGCGGPSPTGGEAAAGKSQPATADPTANELGGRVSRLIEEATAKYRPLEYEYDEDLLASLDRIEERLSGKSPKLDPRPMPRLDEAEQVEHFRETVRRWTAKTGKNLRAEIDPLKAEVAARKPGGPPFHPDFHKKFSAAFDDLIPIEVAELRERRNRYIHEKAGPILDEYRAKIPDDVNELEKTLNQPPYDLPQGSNPPPGPTQSGAADSIPKG